MDDQYGFSARFRAMNDQELIEAFNSQVCNQGTVSAKFIWMAAMLNEFNHREYDYAVIGDGQILSFGNKIRLEGKQILLQDV